MNVLITCADRRTSLVKEFAYAVHRRQRIVVYKELLESELGWKDYGGKHYESIWTKFFQAYILPTKFGVDKRKSHLSSMICAGKLDRDSALAELAKPLYEPDEFERDLEIVLAVVP